MQMLVVIFVLFIHHKVFSESKVNVTKLTERVAVAVTLWTRVWEVPISNLSQILIFPISSGTCPDNNATTASFQILLNSSVILTTRIM